MIEQRVLIDQQFPLPVARDIGKLGIRLPGFGSHGEVTTVFSLAKFRRKVHTMAFQTRLARMRRLIAYDLQLISTLVFGWTRPNWI